MSSGDIGVAISVSSGDIGSPSASLHDNWGSASVSASTSWSSSDNSIFTSTFVDMLTAGASVRASPSPGVDIGPDN